MLSINFIYYAIVSQRQQIWVYRVLNIQYICLKYYKCNIFVLQDFGIPESSIVKAPEIYTLGSNTVYERLCKLKETPELASFINNPQVARLIYYHTKVNSRLKYLQSKNCVSLNLLVTNNYSFNRFLHKSLFLYDFIV